MLRALRAPGSTFSGRCGKPKGAVGHLCKTGAEIYPGVALGCSQYGAKGRARLRRCSCLLGMGQCDQHFRACLSDFKEQSGSGLLAGLFWALLCTIPFFFFLFFPAEVILSYLKPTPNGTLSAPCISDTTPAQMLSAIVFLTVTRHSITRDPGTFCSPAFELNENRFVLKKKKERKKKKNTFQS